MKYLGFKLLISQFIQLNIFIRAVHFFFIVLSQRHLTPRPNTLSFKSTALVFLTMEKESEQTITISEKTFDRINKRLGHTEFNTVEEYIEYVLDELTLYVDAQFDADETEDVDEGEVKERLQSLGYLRE